MGETALLEKGRLGFPDDLVSVFGAVEMAVAWGRAHLDLSDIQSLGIDEIAWQSVVTAM